MKCKHDKNYKLFFMKDKNWVRTKYSICKECGEIVVITTTVEEVK